MSTERSKNNEYVICFKFFGNFKITLLNDIGSV